MNLPDDWEALAIPPHESWMDDALCAQIGGGLWDSPDNDGPGANYSKDARKVCRRCPVMDPCALYGVAHAELEGMWGGMSPRQRVAIRRVAGA